MVHLVVDVVADVVVTVVADNVAFSDVFVVFFVVIVVVHRTLLVVRSCLSCPNFFNVCRRALCAKWTFHFAS